MGCCVASARACTQKVGSYEYLVTFRGKINGLVMYLSIRLSQRLPVIPIPLKGGDPDARLDLRSRRCYLRPHRTDLKLTTAMIEPASNRQASRVGRRALAIKDYALSGSLKPSFRRCLTVFRRAFK